MKKNYSVLIFPSAQNDIQEVIAYLEYNLHTSSKNLISKLLDKIDLLTSSLFAFPLVKDELLKNMGYRIIPVDNYLVFYIIKDTRVEIHRFLYGKRDYLNILS